MNNVPDPQSPSDSPKLPTETPPQSAVNGTDAQPDSADKKVAPARDHMSCYECGYDLSGLPPDTACPECKAPYSKSLEFHNRPKPTVREMATKLFWPVGAGLIAAFLLLLSGGLSGSSESAPFGFFIAIAALINAVNLPLVSSSLSSQYVPRHRRGRWSRNMFYLGTWVGIAWVVATVTAVVTVVLPVLFFGGCLIMMASGGFR